jgi:hypothetical protein
VPLIAVIVLSVGLALTVGHGFFVLTAGSFVVLVECAGEKGHAHRAKGTERSGTEFDRSAFAAVGTSSRSPRRESRIPLADV